MKIYEMVTGISREVFFLIFTLIYILYAGCFPPRKIERYIERHCDFERTDICYIDMRKVFKKRYDVMYIFGSSADVKTARDIMGINDYKKWTGGPNRLGYDSDDQRIILVKNNKVVAEYITHLRFTKCTQMRSGYMCTNHIFKITSCCNPYRIIPTNCATESICYDEGL
jgi:hypothetical protein